MLKCGAALTRIWSLKHFEHQIFSCEVRLIKPDPAIFELCVSHLKYPSSDVLFIDDRQPNIEAARKIGLRAIQFESARQLRAELKEFGFKVLPNR